MAPRKTNKTDPRNTAKPVSQLRGAAKQARISKVTKAEAGPATVRGGMAPGAGRSKPVGTGGGGVTKPSGTPKMVNANKPVMQKLVRKAAQARKAASGRPLVKPVEAQRLMSQRAPGIRQGAAQLRQQAAGTQSPGAQARAAARGKEAVKAAQVKRGARQAMKNMEGTLKAARTARRIAGGLKSLTRGGAAAAGLQAYNTADGTLTAARKRGDYVPSKFASARAKAIAKAKSIKGSPVVGSKKSSAQQFDSAFKAARSAGKSSFSWRGKKYTTKMK